MASLLLFDSAVRTSLLPLTYSRPVGDLRVGSLTIREKWERTLGLAGSYLTVPSLRALFPATLTDDNLFIDGAVLPDAELVGKINALQPGQAYRKAGRVVAARLGREAAADFTGEALGGGVEFIELDGYELNAIQRPADIFLQNAAQIKLDYALLTAGRESAPYAETNTVIGPPENLFLEAGVTMEACVLNVTDGPVYIGPGATLLEGALLRGPIAIGEKAVVKMGAKVYGGTTIGPLCKVGGEVNNVVFYGNSNKGHDGFLGNAVVGEWCNVGADTNASNLKNDYGEVRVWNYATESFARTGLQFHGLIMADHAKLAINVMLNTGTVIGFSANVFGAGFPRNFVPSFSWGGSANLSTYRLNKALDTARRVMLRRQRDLSAADEQLFAEIFAASSVWRRWDRD